MLIFVPGYFGTQLVENDNVIWPSQDLSRLQLPPYPDEKDSLNPATPIMIYDDLNFADEFDIWGWDWRKDINYSANLLANYIEEQKDKITIIAHAEGAMMVLAALTMIKLRPSIEKIDVLASKLA